MSAVAVIPSRCTITSKINDTPKGVYLPIKTKVKFVTAVKFHYRVQQLTTVFLSPLGGSIYFAGDDTN